MAFWNLLLAFVAADGNLTPSEISFFGPTTVPFSRAAVVIMSPKVQKILGVSTEQRANIEALRLNTKDHQVRSATKSLDGQFRMVDDRIELTFDENDATVLQILNEEQRRSLGQIQLQGYGPVVFFKARALAQYVGISDVQRTRLDDAYRKADAARWEELRRGIDPRNPPRPSELRERNRVDPLTFLTDEQRSRAEKLLGEKQPINEISSELRPLGGGGRLGASAAIQSVLGDFTEPFRFLFVEGLLLELGVTEEQRAKLIEWIKAERKECAELTRRVKEDKGGESAKLRLAYRNAHPERVKKCWTKLKEILSKEQLKRFEEIRLQARGYNELFSTSEGAKKLGVTDVQRDSLRDAMRENVGEAGRIIERMAEILTEKQKADFTRMQGAPVSKLLIQDLRASQNMAFSDPFGIPLYGIGKEK